MSETNNNQRIKTYLNLIRRGLKHMFLHNGLLKLIAILISIVLWAGLISQDDSLTRDKTFQNVNVTVTGSEILKNNRLIVVSNLEEMLNDVSVVAAVPQKQYENAEASAYNLRLDLSRIKGTGKQEVKLQSTNSSIYGRVVSTNPSSLTIDVEDYFVRQRVPVTVSVNGDIPDGWYMSTPSVDPNLIAIGGPGSLVQTILRARAYIDTKDIEWKEGASVISSDIHLFNRTGDEVNSPFINITSASMNIDTVLIDYTLLRSKSYDTADLIQYTGEVAGGYRISNVKVSPEYITVAARQEVLEQMAELPLERNSVNVNGLKETTVFQLKVQKPSDDAVISNETVTVTVEIEPEEP